jgi:hypothetical protein
MGGQLCARLRRTIGGGAEMECRGGRGRTDFGVLVALDGELDAIGGLGLDFKLGAYTAASG